MGRTKIYQVDKIHSLVTDTTFPARTYCNVDAFIKALRKCFLRVPDGFRLRLSTSSYDTTGKAWIRQSWHLKLRFPMR